MGFAVLAAILGELQGGSIARRGTPQIPQRVCSRNGAASVRPALVVAAFQVMPTLEHQAGVGEAITHGLGGNDDGVRHTHRTVHGELDICQLRHVFQDPLSAQLGNTVQGIVGGIEGVDDVHGDGAALWPVRPGSGHRVEN